MSPYRKAAAKAVAGFLACREEPVTLYDLSKLADKAALDAGKVRDLFPSLYPYADLLPDDWTTGWLGTGGFDSMLYCMRKDWEPGKDRSQTPVLGGGLLQRAPTPLRDLHGRH